MLTNYQAKGILQLLKKKKKLIYDSGEVESKKKLFNMSHKC